MVKNLRKKTDELKILRIPRVEKAPWLYGDMRDDVWSKAAEYDTFLDCTEYYLHRYNLGMKNPESFKEPPLPCPAAETTSVRLCHDGKSLYIGFDCLDRQIKSLLKRDRPYGHLVEREDHVFACIDPELDHLSPYVNKYIVNAAGQKSEILKGKKQGDYISMMGWEGSACVDKDRWRAELTIPFERLGISSENCGVFGINLGRGWRGQQRSYLLICPDEDFICGWGIGILEDFNKTTRSKAFSFLNSKIEIIRRRQSGASLSSEPGSPGFINPHRDQNAMIGLSLWGPDHRPTISLGRSDSYDRRWYGNEYPVVTRAEVVEAAMSGDMKNLDILRDRSCGNQYSAYPFPCPKPVGQLVIMLPGGEQAGWKTDVSHGSDGAIDLTCRSKDGEINLHAYVHKRRDLIVVEGRNKGIADKNLKVRVHRHNDSVETEKREGYDYDKDTAEGRQTGPLPDPHAGQTDCFGYIRQDFYPEETFPGGFQTAIVATVTNVKNLSVTAVNRENGLGTPARSPMEDWIDPGTGQNWAATRYKRLNGMPGSAATISCRLQDSAFRIAAAVVSTNNGTNVISTGKQILDSIKDITPEELERESMDTPVEERVGGYSYKQDLALSSIFSAKFCFVDSVAWHGDFHFNEFGSSSYGINFYNYFLEGRTAELENYFQMVEENLPAAKALAKEAFGCEGAAWGVASFPKRFKRLPMTNLDWDYSLECTGLVVQPFWLTWQYTLNNDFLRNRAYPVIREGALFYTSYASLEDDGYYHISPCVSSEHVTLQPYLRYNKDSNAALSMARFIIAAAIDGAKRLSLDSGRLPGWEKVLARLAPYPTEQTPEGERFVDIAGARLMSEYNIFQPLFAVFFGNDIGLASPDDVLEKARLSLQGLKRLSTTHWGHVYRAMKRLGIYPGGPVEDECFLQSHQGPVFLFPAVPENYTGEFRNLHARGAFILSASMSEGRVKNMEIRSIAGGTFRLAADKTPGLRELLKTDTRGTWKPVGKRYMETEMEAGDIRQMRTAP